MKIIEIGCISPISPLFSMFLGSFWRVNPYGSRVRVPRGQGAGRRRDTLFACNMCENEQTERGDFLCEHTCWIGPGKLPLCLCVEMPPKRPQICYFFAPKYAIVEKDVTFPRVTSCDPAKNVTFFVKLFRRTASSRNAYSDLKVHGSNADMIAINAFAPPFAPPICATRDCPFRFFFLPHGLKYAISGQGSRKNVGNWSQIC